MSQNMRSIPEEWIDKYVGNLLKYATDLRADSNMRASVLLRAEYAMDLVEAYRKHKLETEGP